MFDREMQMAWAEKHQKLEEIFAHAQKAPTLFNPEYVEQLKADIANAEKNYRVWL